MDRFVRTARPAAVMAGPLAIASIVLEFSTGGSPQAMASTTGVLGAALALLAVLGLLVGLISLYVVQAERTRTLALAGLLVGIVGAVMTAGTVWSSVFVVPGLADVAPDVLDTGLSTVLVGSVISYGILGIGALLTGISTLKTDLFRRGPAVTMIVGGVLCLAPLPARYVVVAIAVSILATQLTRAARLPISAAVTA